MRDAIFDFLDAAGGEAELPQIQQAVARRFITPPDFDMGPPLASSGGVMGRSEVRIALGQHGRRSL